MVRRLSNRARIEQKAAEAEAAKAEKTEKKTKTAKKKTTSKKTTTKKKTAAGSIRQKLVWKVANTNFKEVAIFPYPEKKAADAKAAELTEKTGKNHFVNAIKVPMED